ncbi:hypothetical protein [Prochlorococcus sp. MIT 1306]|uniref:hypothetical protein n=1 Tax=Prochlorococcus sp. MIT 1306 TaxID=1799667 RepID=UPI0012E92967|nr:hypothetical protein [Prochlorococcus sp. MIT 1306]
MADVSNHGIEALFMALTHQDHRMQGMHRFSSAGLTKTIKERLLNATVGLVAIIANVDLANCDYKNVVANTL